MTERPPRRRASKRELRAWAWIAGALAFLAPLAALGVSPKPPASAGSGERPAVVIRQLTRRVVVLPPAAEAPARFVAASGAAPDGTTSSVNAAPTTTGGS